MNVKAMLIVCSAALLLFCGQKPVTKPEVTKPEVTKPSTALPVIVGFTLRSPGFEDNGAIPDKYTGMGANVSPALSWYNPPPATQSYALIVDDPDAPSGTFTHWVVYNVSKESNSMPEGLSRSEVLPNGGHQARNSFGRTGYDGPMPPPGKVHHYIFTLFALDKVLDAPIADKKTLLAALEGHALGKAVLTGTYRR